MSATITPMRDGHEGDADDDAATASQVVIDLKPVNASTLHFERGCVVNILEPCESLTLVFQGASDLTVHGNVKSLVVTLADGGHISIEGGVRALSSNGTLHLDVRGDIGTLVSDGMIVRPLS